MQILDGKIIAEIETKKLIEEFKEATELIGRRAKLSIIQVGDNPSSNKYIQYKMKKAEQLNVEVNLYKYPETITQKELLKEIEGINENSDGIIVQLPLINFSAPQVILDSVQFKKDIDGLSTRNTFNFYNSTSTFHFTPATAMAILTLIDYYQIPIENQKISVVGRSYLVGKPIAFLLKKRNGIVSTYNITSGLRGTENADLLIAAAGKAKLIKRKNVKEGAIVIDVGCNLDDAIDRSKLVGDVDMDEVQDVLSAIAPVPGGIGPLTVVSLFKNLLKAFKEQNPY
ncbi:bifunctional 5,10-methylenetetrahydrofolate dehydrogenase/5,10-methenyltetrahydrofolate cyclohydrolase [Mycoplasmopsis hyopharyngis]|uniref:bifunctional 5,10-methylenetetrahydrofolate dehydrogenase/5,10-methenyltetrahydrofolate cyclohydrolase n=1 Tax=Mycoplasmopsis hyopharyngis TaxID=29558 RepID=UPI00387308AE